MANPQPDEFTRISNELLEQLCKTKINGEAMQIFLVILRKTYGFNKKSEKISLNYFSELTNIPTSNCSRSIKKLENMNIISVIRNEYISEYSIQKDYEKWQLLSKTIVSEPTIKYDSESTINADSNTINPDSETTINADRYKRKKESLKESKERGTSLTSQKITSKEIQELFINHSKISEPNHKTHINPILEVLANIPPELNTQDVQNCLFSVFSKLNKGKGVKMDFLLTNLRKAISNKHEKILLEQKQQQIKQAEIDRYNNQKSAITQKIEDAKQYQLQTAEKIIKYSEFYNNNLSLFSTMEKFEIQKAFKNNSITLVEHIFFNKMNLR